MKRDVRVGWEKAGSGIIRFGGLALPILAFMSIAQATTVESLTFDELVERAETVFEGRVVGMESKWVGEGNTRRIKTYYSFQVDEVLKGEAASPYILEVLGGTVGDVTLKVDGAPIFSVGGRVILFVTDNGTQFVPLVGIMHGHYKVEKDAGGSHEVVKRHDGIRLQDTTDIGKPSVVLKKLRSGAASSPGLTAESFKERIRERVSGGKR